MKQVWLLKWKKKSRYCVKKNKKIKYKKERACFFLNMIITTKK